MKTKEKMEEKGKRRRGVERKRQRSNGEGGK